MVSIAQLESWQPGKLSSIADDLNTKRGKLVDLQDEIDAGKPPASWVGVDSYYAETKHTELGDQLVDDVAEIASVISALDTASTDIKAAQDSLDGAISSIRSAGFELDRSTGTISDPHSYEADDLEGPQHARTRMNALAEQIGTALTDAETADTALAAALNRANKGDIDVDGNLSSLGLEAMLRDMSPEDQATYLLDHPDRGREVLDILSPAVKREIGEQLADRTDDIMDPDNEIDADWLEKLNEQYDAYGEDPAISTAYLNDMGPDKLVELNGWIADLQKDDDFPENYSDDDMLDPDLAEQMGAIQTNLGQLLSAGTSGLTHDGQPGTDTHVSADWVQQLVAKGDDVVQVGYSGIDGDYQQKAYGYQLLGPLLRSADSGYLLNEVGDGMLKFETDFAREHGQIPWAFPIIDDEGVVIGGRTDGVDQTAYMDGLRFDWTQGTGEDDQAGFDPMGGLLDGLSNNPQAARDFFTGDDVPVEYFTSEDGPSGDSEWKDVSRTDYLLTDRGWAPDHTNWSRVHQYDELGPGGQEYLGDALRAATIDDPTDPGQRDQIRDIMQDTVSSISDDEAVRGHDNRYLDDRQTEEHFETDWIDPALREDIASMLGHHGDAVYGTFDSGSDDVNSDGDWQLKEQGRFGIQWDKDDLRNVLRDLGKDPEAGGIVNQSVTEQAYDAIQAHPGQDENVGKTLGDVFTTVGEGRNAVVEDQWRDEDQGYNDGVDRKAAVAEFIVGKIPTGSNPVVGFAFDQATGAIIDSWKESNYVDRDGDLNYMLDNDQNVRERYAHLLIQQELARLGR